MALLETRARAFNQTSTDVAAETFASARFIGNLIKDKTRLAAVSALTGNDPLDIYRFRVTRGTLEAGLVSTSDKGVRIQLASRNGNIIADSDASFGDKKDNYDKLLSSKLKLDNGDYYILVRRSDGTLNTAQPNYLVQLQTGSGKFTEDYETIERPAPRVQRAQSFVASAQNSVAEQLANNAVALQNLTPLKSSSQFNFIKRRI